LVLRVVKLEGGETSERQGFAEVIGALGMVPSEEISVLVGPRLVS
jgi:hypothetical protein